MGGVLLSFNNVLSDWEYKSEELQKLAQNPSLSTGIQRGLPEAQANVKTAVDVLNELITVLTTSEEFEAAAPVIGTQIWDVLFERTTIPASFKLETARQLLKLLILAKKCRSSEDDQGITENHSALSNQFTSIALLSCKPGLIT